ncbi:MAG: TonB-dependent receptor [Verrucomicrobiota bacterium]
MTRWHFLALVALCRLDAGGAMALAAEPGKAMAAAEARRTFDIKADTAERSLRAFATQAGQQVLFSTEIVGGVETRAVRGSFSPADALRALLDGTTLAAVQDAQSAAWRVHRKTAAKDAPPTSRFNPNPTMKPATLLSTVGGWLALAASPAEAQPAPAARPASQETAIELSPFEISASTDIGYLATNSSSATRFATASRDLPLALQTITSEMLADQAQFDLNDALSATVAGLQAGNIPRQSIIRGMASDYPLRNGIPTFGIQDIAHIERIEILKGASGVLYGVSQPGGVRNLLSVRPPSRPMFSITQRFDSDDRARTEVRFGGPIDRAGKLAYRFIAVYDEYQKYADYQVRYDRLLYPAVQWKPTPTTTVFYEYDYKRFSAIGSAGFLQVRVPGETFNRFATPQNSGLDLPYAFNVSGPNTNVYQRVRVSNLIVDQKISDVWSSRATYSWQPYEGYTPRYLQNGQGAPGRRTFNNLANLGVQHFRQEMARLDFLATVKRPKYSNRTLIGADYLWRVNNTRTFRAATRNANGVYATTLFSLNVDDYARPSVENRWLYDFTGFSEKNPVFTHNAIWDETVGAYVVNQFSFNRERTFILGGLRYDRIKTSTKNLVTNFLPGANFSNPLGTRVSPQLGIAHRLSDGVSIYANYSSSVYGNSQVNPDGSGFPPQFGEGFDGGVKVELFENRVSGTVSLFRTDNKNLPVPDPAADTDPARAGYFVLRGKTRAEGVDASFTLSPWKSVQSVLGYTYSDAFDQMTGEQLPGTSTHSMNLWTRWDVGGAFKGLALGGGPRWRNKLYRGVVQEPYRGDLTTIDLFASYTRKIGGHRYLFQLNVRNLTDEVEINDFNHPFGTGRTYLGTVRFEF